MNILLFQLGLEQLGVLIELFYKH